MPRILIVEDEQDLASLLVYNLKQAGFEVDVATCGAAAMSKAQSFKPDLVLLDLMLPDIPGTDVLRMLRADPARGRAAVVMVTAKGREEDRIRGLELGADDYVAKPFSVRELVLRVQAVLRRTETSARAQGELAIGELRLDEATHRVSTGARELFLTALEFRLLQTLMERAGRVQTREALLSDVWGIDAEITTRTVDTHIQRLREKLGTSGELIETVRGVGYRLARSSGNA
jgi:two-component system phosphate regulon response regulator PhoB